MCAIKQATIPDEYWLYRECTHPLFFSKGARPALTIDQVQSVPPLTTEQVYALPNTPQIRWQVAQLVARFGWSYEEARSVPSSLAEWFIQFYDVGNTPQAQPDA